MDKMKTLKIASKYLLMLATFCILSENYLCYTKVIEETPNYATKEYVTTSTTTRRSRTLKNVFNFSERREASEEVDTQIEKLLQNIQAAKLRIIEKNGT